MTTKEQKNKENQNMKTNIPTQPRLTENEQNVLTWAFNMTHSIVAGDYGLPKPMCYALNRLQDVVYDLADERGISIKEGCSKDYLAFNEGYWSALDENLKGVGNDDET